MLFHYIAIDPKGETITGEKEAPDERALAKALRAEGFLMTEASSGRSMLNLLKGLNISFGGVSLFDRMIFARNIVSSLSKIID